MQTKPKMALKAIMKANMILAYPHSSCLHHWNDPCRISHTICNLYMHGYFATKLAKLHANLLQSLEMRNPLSLKTLKVVVVDSLYWRTRRGKKCTHHQYSDMSKKESISRLLVMHACANCLHLCLAMMSYVMLVHYNFASCVCVFKRTFYDPLSINIMQIPNNVQQL